MYIFVLSRLTARKEGFNSRRSVLEWKILNEMIVVQIDKKQDAPAASYNFESTRPNISSVLLPQSHSGRINGGASASLGSSLPSPSPLPSPMSFNFEGVCVLISIRLGYVPHFL
jgi:hypothetical protein